MIKLVDILKEVGDASAKPYKFDLYIDDEYTRTYGFYTDSDMPYSVEIEQEDEDEEGGVTIDVRFFVVSEDDPDIEDYDTVTNKGELYRVMSTITNIIQQEISNNPKINKISFLPAKRSNQADDSARLNLYTRYLTKLFPGAQFEKGERGKTIVKIK